MREEAPVPEVPLGRQLVVVAFLTLLLALVVRTHVRVDDRWGFSMFRDVTMITAEYRWHYPDGRSVAVSFDGILHGDARMMGNRRAPMDWILGVGAYRDMAEQVVEHLGTEHLPEGATGVSAVLRWRLWDRGPWTTERIEWPR